MTVLALSVWLTFSSFAADKNAHSGKTTPQAGSNVRILEKTKSFLLYTLVPGVGVNGSFSVQALLKLKDNEVAGPDLSVNISCAASQQYKTEASGKVKVLSEDKKKVLQTFFLEKPRHAMFTADDPKMSYLCGEQGAVIRLPEKGTVTIRLEVGLTFSNAQGSGTTGMQVMEFEAAR